MKSKTTKSSLQQFVVFLAIFIFPISILAQEKQIREKTDSLKQYFEKARAWLASSSTRSRNTRGT